MTVEGTGPARQIGAIVTLIAVALALGCAAAPAARGADPDLRGQWHLDEGATGAHDDSVSSTPDSSGNGLTAIVRYTGQVPGRFATAFSFGPSSLSEVPGNALLRPEHLTAVAWVRAVASPGNLRYIVAQGGSDGCIPAAYGLYTSYSGGPNPGGLSFYVNHGGVPYQAAGVPPASVWNGAWHMVAGTFDGAKARFYVDGTEIGDGMHDGTDVPGPIDYSQPSSAFRIGRYGRFGIEPCAGATTSFAGDIDEVRIYSRALNAAEIRGLAGNTWTSPPAIGDLDLTPPSTTIAVGPPGPTASGYYPDQVRLAVTATDNASTVETRCVMDPPMPPGQFEDLPEGCLFLSPLNVIQPGTHAIYAASRDGAGNVERPVISRSFRLLRTPRTTILDGPTSPTWDSAPLFTFATPMRSSFECRVDGRAWTPCSSPYRSPGLASGPHTFSVRATSPDGAVELVPPVWSFAVSAAVTQRADCNLSPIRHWYIGGTLNDFFDGPGPYSWACAFGPTPRSGCPGGYSCIPREFMCPRGARCSMTNRASWIDDDTNARQGADTFETVGPLETDARNIGFVRTRKPYSLSNCITKRSGDRCSTQSRLVVFGEDEPLYSRCAWDIAGDGATYSYSYVGAVTGPITVFGSADDRRLRCAVSVTIASATALEALVVGQTVSISIPSPGMLVVTGQVVAGQVARSSRARAAASPRIATTRVTVAKPGPVRIVPHLNPTARRALRRAKQLKISLRLAFTPSDGAKVVRTQRLTLRPVARPLRVCLPSKPNRKLPPIPKPC